MSMKDNLGGEMTITKKKLIKLFNTTFIVTVLVFITMNGIVSVTFLNNSNDLDQSNEDTSESLTPHSSAAYSLVFLLGTNQTHTAKGHNFTLLGYAQKFTTDAPIGIKNASGIPVYPVINGVHYDGRDGRENRTTFTDSQGLYNFSIKVNETYDISNDYNVWANISITSADVIIGEDSIQNASINHDITSLTQIDLNTIITSPLFDGNSFIVQYNITDELGNDLGLTENISVYRNNSLSDILVSETDFVQDVGSDYINITYTPGTTHIGLHFEGTNFTITDGESYYQYASSNFSTAVEYLTARVFLLDVNQTHTLRGNSFTYSGYTQQLINNQFVNRTGIEVYPIIDGTHFPGNSTLSGAGGLFSFTVDVAADYDNTADMTLNANITENIGDNVIVGVSSIANSSLIQDITSRTNLSILIDNSIPKLIGDEFDLEITLTDELGGLFTIPTNRFELYRNRNLTSTLSQTGINIEALDSTVLIQNIIQENGVEYIGVHFLGVPTTKPGESYLEYQAFNASTFIRRVQAINGSFSFANAVRNTTLPYVFTQGDVFLNGTISMDENYTVVSQTVDFYLNGQFIGYTETNTEGYFEFTFNLAEEGFAVNTSIDACVITLNLRNMDSEYLGSNTSTSINTITLTIEDGVPYVAPTNTSLIAGDVPLKWMNIVYVGLGVVALVVGLVIFQRQRMDRSSKRDRKLRKVDYSRFENVNVLYNQGRRREAIAYTYKIFADLINEKYGLVREEHETIRVFAITCVTKYGLDPMRTYPYLALVENIVYGFYDLNLEAFKKSMLVFGRVFQEITGTMLEFTLIESSDGGLESEQTLKIGAVSE
ncbi:hypothetical protein [Candidatus Lokiarchaeum ossiferum]|uniref:hypothetical protein n=1 Tax=Candidatus Lokiarchaeum ossiferum TaxID=2951803 RepID=UPI00352E5172